MTWISIARFSRFVFYIARISEQGCLGVYSQSNLLDRMLRLHSYQPCPHDNLTNLHYNAQDGILRILVTTGLTSFIRREIGTS